jgi:malate dehydrogenase
MATTITITGAGGQIGYALLFRIAAGDMLGEGEKVRLRLLEIPQGVKAAEGAALELQDGAFELLESVDVTDDAPTGFDGCDIALLVGARPRGSGMERGDLLAANAGIFGPQGEAIAARASSDVRVTVVGNPANTNALAAVLDAPVAGIRRVPIWGNHSATQFPDVTHATVAGRPVLDALAERVGDVRGWLEGTFIPRVAKRGAEIIEVRGSSSVASAANAAIEHTRDWVRGTTDWTSAGVVSHGEYGVPEGLVSSFPVRAVDGDWQIVEGLEIDEWARGRIDASVAELVEERNAVRTLGAL